MYTLQVEFWVDLFLKSDVSDTQNFAWNSTEAFRTSYSL